MPISRIMLLVEAVAPLLLLLLVCGGHARAAPAPSGLRLSMQRDTNSSRHIFITMEPPGGEQQAVALELSEENWRALCHAEETATPTQEPTTPAPPLSCDPDYKLVAGVGCYRLETQELKWGQARAFCDAHGSRLAIPNSRQKLQALWDFGRQFHFSEFWTGIHKIDKSWKTVEGHLLSSDELSHWAPGSGRDYDCSYMGVKGLYPFPCHYTFPFFCEQQAKAPSQGSVQDSRIGDNHNYTLQTNSIADQ